jgi:tRNA(fMet)-specific endonuclease VapC
MLLGTIGRNASPRHKSLVVDFVARLSTILYFDRIAAEEAMRIAKDLRVKGTSIGGNDAMIAGHAIAADRVLVTNNVREFSRVENLRLEDWAG